MSSLNVLRVEYERALLELKKGNPDFYALSFAQPLYDAYKAVTNEVRGGGRHNLQLHPELKNLFDHPGGREERGGRRPAVMDLANAVLVRPWSREIYSDEQVQEFSGAMEAATKDGKSVVLDLSRVESTNSIFLGAAIRLLVSLKGKGCDLILCGVSARMQHKFNFTNLSAVFPNLGEKEGETVWPKDIHEALELLDARKKAGGEKRSVA